MRLAELARKKSSHVQGDVHEVDSSQVWQQHHDQPMCSAVLDAWRLVLTVVCGATEVIIPRVLVKDHVIQRITRLAKRIELNSTSVTEDLSESWRAEIFCLDPVDEAFGSVMRRCSSGHVVVFEDDGTGEDHWTRE